MTDLDKREVLEIFPMDDGCYGLFTQGGSYTGILTKNFELLAKMVESYNAAAGYLAAQERCVHKYVKPVCKICWPDEYVLVPREPTEEMCEVGGDIIRDGEVKLEGKLRLSLHGWGGYQVYKAMIEAAQKAGE